MRVPSQGVGWVERSETNTRLLGLRLRVDPTYTAAVLPLDPGQMRMRPIVRDLESCTVWPQGPAAMLTWTSCRDCAVRTDALCGAIPMEDLAQFNRVARH